MDGMQAIPIVTYFIPIPTPHSPLITLLPQLSGTPPGPVLHGEHLQDPAQADYLPPMPIDCKTCLFK